MSASPESGERSPAAAFAEFLARRNAGEELELEEFCADQPQLAAELHRLHASWLRGPGDVDRTASLSQRLEDAFGSGVDPSITLEASPRLESSASELLASLGRTPGGKASQRRFQRVPAGVCLATNPDLEGEGTARLVAERLRDLGELVRQFLGRFFGALRRG